MTNGRCYSLRFLTILFRLRLSLFLLQIFILSLSSVLSAQDRPRIGLVLSGGAAHGLAHIGVLKFLEEQEIPVDYITGTSMGSIIGAMYAMGMTAREIESVTTELDWDEILSNTVPLNEIAPSEKKHHDKIPLLMKYDKDGIHLPQSAIQSVKLELLLNRIFSPAAHIKDFDDLPIPFRCAAVDIETGEIQILKSGSLASAVRASMAIPTVFTPVDRDGRLYVDGGLRRNFPVEENLEMGAEYTIGVYVGSTLKNKKELHSLVDILSQSSFLMGILDSEEQKKKVDVLIEPDIKDLPVFGFGLSSALIKEGYLAAQEQIEAIQRIKTIIGNREKDSHRIEPLRIPVSYNISSINFSDIPKPYDALASFKFGGIRRRPYRLEEIEAGILRIFGTRNFEIANYSIRQNAEKLNVLDILAVPRKEWVFGGNVNYFTSTQTSFLFRSELRNILGPSSLVAFNARLSENYAVSGELNYRLGKKKDYLITIDGSRQRYSQKLFDKAVIRDRFTQSDFGLNLGIAYEPNNYLMISLNNGLRMSKLDPEQNEPNGFGSYDRQDYKAEFRFSLNSLDQQQFPQSGWDLSITYAYTARLGGSVQLGPETYLSIPDERNYLDLAARILHILPIGSSLLLSTSVNFGHKTESSLLHNYRIGGLEDRDMYSIFNPGLRTHSLQLYKYLQGSLNPTYCFNKYLFGGIHLAYLNGRSGFHAITFNPDQNIRLISYGTLLGVRTPLGPIQFALGSNTYTNKWTANFSLGYTLF